MKTIPVTVGFDGKREPIGTMEIDETKLPAGCNYVFALGGMVNSGIPGTPCAEVKGDDFDLRQVAVVDDKDYLSFLRAREAAGCL